MNAHSPSFDTEPTYGMRNALRVVLLFLNKNWTADTYEEFRRITGHSLLTADLLRDHLRKCLELGCSGNCLSEGERLWGLSAGHVLTERDVEDIKHIINDHNDQIEEAADSFHLGRIDAWRRLGGQKLVDEMLAKEAVQTDEMVERAMERFRDRLGERQ